jgi:hypothetical protein
MVVARMERGEGKGRWANVDHWVRNYSYEKKFWCSSQYSDDI